MLKLILCIPIDDGTYSEYHKDDVTCQENLSYQTNPYLDLSCGEFDKATYDASVPFFTAVHEYNPSVASISVDKQFGDFATGSAWFEGVEGFLWIARNNQGTWHVIFGGQATIDCKIVAKYAIPKVIYGDCYSAP